MDSLAIITRHLIAPAWALWERSPYLWHYRTLLRTQFDSPEIIRCREWEKIESLLDHAYRTPRFYRERLQTAGLEPGHFRSFDQFRAVPLLTKADLRTHGAEMLSSEFAGGELHQKRASGSTGTSVEVLVAEGKYLNPANTNMASEHSDGLT